MNQRIRDLALSLLAILALPLIFVAIQGLLARYNVPAILALRDTLGDRAAVYSVIYVSGAIGAMLSATLVALPLGWALSARPYLNGAIVGLASSALLSLIAEDMNIRRQLEYAILIAATALTAGLGDHLKRRWWSERR